MSGEDIALDEKRIYGDKRASTVTYVASDVGLARVEVSADQVGRISLLHREAVRDVAGAAGRLLVAGTEDVYVGDDGALAPTGFGTATAVGASRDRLVAVDGEGRVARLAGEDWRTVGTVDSPRRSDGDLLATGDGVIRVGADALRYLGLADVRDVAAAGPYAATADRVYGRGDGEWRPVREGGADVVAASATQVHAVAGTRLLAGEDGDWHECDLPVDERVVDVGYGEATYAVTEPGTFLVDADPETTPDGSSGWRHRALGVSGVSALAVP